MEAGTWLLLALIVGGLGFGGVALLRPRPALERLALVFPVGLGFIAPILLAMRALHVPIDLRILLALGVAAGAAGYWRIRGEPAAPTRRSESLPILAAIVLTGALTAMMVIGAKGYPWLEDHDSWQHAAGARFVALHQTTVQPEPRVSLVLEPYPPFYTAFIGALHQADDDLNGLLKVVNALMVGLSALAAYFAATLFVGPGWRAVGAACLMAASPSFVGRFIWAQSLAIPVFLIALWALGSLAANWREARRGEVAVALLLVLGATIIQAFTAAISALLLASFVAAGMVRARMTGGAHPAPRIVALLGAGVASALMWGFLARGILYHYAAFPQAFKGGDTLDTSRGVAYGLREFVLTFSQTMDQGTGLGWATSVLAAVGLGAVIWRLRKRDERFDLDLFLLVWLVIALVGVQGNALPVKLFPHRFWVYLAPPVALFAVEGVSVLAACFRLKWVRAVVATALVAGAVGVNAQHRAYMQLRIWPPGGDWAGPNQLNGYLAIARTLPKMTPVLAPCAREEHLIGLNIHSEPWNPDYLELRRNLAAQDGPKLRAFMDAHRVELLAIDEGCVARIGLDEANQLLKSVVATEGLQLVWNAGGVKLFLRKRR